MSNARTIDRRDFLGGAVAAGLVTAGARGASVARADEAAPADSHLHAWEVKPAAIEDAVQSGSYDIVIVGAGVAGLSAAEAAARNGASVLVVERTDSYQARGVDVGHIGSKVQLESGVEIDPRDAAKLLYLWSEQTANYDLIYTWASRSGKVFDHIQEIAEANGLSMIPAVSGTAKYGWDALPERWRIYPDAVTFVRGDETGSRRPDGLQVNWNLADALYNAAVELGVEFAFNTHAEQLVGDAASGISGVIATDADGNHVQYDAAKGVILATGDISGNQEMVDAFAPICNRADDSIYIPHGGNTGDAILMGCWAGAALSKSTAAPMVHQFTMQTGSFTLSSFYQCWLAVNRDGKRYGAELPFEPYLTNARMNQPGNVAWSIFDSDYPTYVEAQWPTKYDQWLDGVEDKIAERLEDGLVVTADTLEELAEKIGVPADTFLETIERYNSMYEAGEDKDFDVPAQFLSQVKTAPFYACKNVCSTLVIPFGLHVNADSQVCTADDEPIAGLFAIGNCQGDFFAFSYPVHCPGVSHGRCVTFGQLVGEALAKDTVLSKTA